MRKVAAMLAIGVALMAANVIPARAGQTERNDPADDANWFVEEGLNPSSDPQFDVTKVKIVTTGDKVIYSALIPGMADATPSLSTGYNIRLSFTHEGVAMWFKLYESPVVTPAALTFSAQAAGAPNVECKGCTGVIDRKTKSVIVTAPIAGLSAAVKLAAPDAPPLGPGAILTSLGVISQRAIGSPTGSGVTATADDATAPTGTDFTV